MTARGLTAEEFERVAGQRRAELVHGEVVDLPTPGWEHGAACTELIVALRAHAQGADLGAVVCSVGFILARDPDVVLGPDVAFVAKHRVPSREAPGFVELAPDLVVEVLSPGDSCSEVRQKVSEYLKAGVREVWLVDPRQRTAEVVRPGAEARVLTVAETLSTDLLPGLAIPLAELFPAA